MGRNESGSDDIQKFDSEKAESHPMTFQAQSQGQSSRIVLRPAVHPETIVLGEVSCAAMST